MAGIGDFLYDRVYAAPSQWAPFAPPAPRGNPLTAMTGPVQSAYDRMYGGGDRQSGIGAGVTSGVSGGVSPGASPGSVGIGGRAAGFNNNVGKVAGRIGSAFGALGGIPGIGTVAGLAGTAYDISNVNDALAEYGTPGLTNGQMASAALNSFTGGIFGTSPNEAFDNAIADYWGPAGYDAGDFGQGPGVTGWDAPGGFEDAYGYGSFSGQDETGSFGPDGFGDSPSSIDDAADVTDSGGDGNEDSGGDGSSEDSSSDDGSGDDGGDDAA